MLVRYIYVVIFLLFLCFYYSDGTIIPKIELNTRIVGGQEVDVKNKNYQVSIQYAGIHFCGGALITSDTVLTAGHCFGTSYPSITVFYQVRAGSNTTSGTTGQVIQIKSVLVHPNYTSQNIDSDICLIKLRGNVTLSSTVGLIRISENENYLTGSYAYVSGWGYQQENGTLSPFLRHAAVPISPRSNCERAYSGLINITRNMICAGYPDGGTDACQGDSGGPLVQNNQLIGVVSFGLGCARKSYPGVYTNVARLVDWVVENSDYVKSGNSSDSNGSNDGGSWIGYFGNGKQHQFNKILVSFSVIFCVINLTHQVW